MNAQVGDPEPTQGIVDALEREAAGSFAVVVATAVDGITAVLEEHGVYRDDHGGFNYGSRCRGRGCGKLRFANDDAAARHQAEFVLAHLRARS